MWEGAGYYTCSQSNTDDIRVRPAWLNGTSTVAKSSVPAAEEERGVVDEVPSLLRSHFTDYNSNKMPDDEGNGTHHSFIKYVTCFLKCAISKHLNNEQM